MPPRIQKKSSSYKIAGEVRRSQIVSTYGSGAIVDFPRLSGIMTGIDLWNISDGSLPKDARFQEHNLQKMLGKEFFVQVSTDDNSEYKFSIPVFRFPRMYYCPECHELDRYNNLAQSDNSTSEYNRALYCNRCKGAGKTVKLVPSRFVAACLNGHIDDFPYDWWVHRGHPHDSEKERNLYLEYKGNTGGLDSIHIRCDCGAHTTMAGCMDKEALSALHCSCNMPWLGFDDNKKPWYKDPAGCAAVPRTMQRSANNVYYAVTQSALTIPPWSKKIQKVFQRYDDILKYIFENEGELREKQLESHYNKYSQEYRCSFESFRKEVYHCYEDDRDEEINEKSLRIDEYNAFLDIDRVDDDDLFRTKSSEVPDELTDYIDVIKVVSRLREVKVLKGFRRIDPAADPENSEKYAPISKSPLPWLPAVQMFGEGIFIKLNEDAVCRWESENTDRYKAMGNRLDVKWIGNDMFNHEKPRYVLLHTLAHLIIRQLTAQCGYETASLREKIYSTFNGSDAEMCGILIYTSATDCDGSLGGLAREGDGYRLGNTILAMLENASWCSNDPICMDSHGQGYKSLNYAACHACGLLPETSCESANCLLDRAAVVGTPENRNIGFFSTLLEE